MKFGTQFTFRAPLLAAMIFSACAADPAVETATEQQPSGQPPAPTAAPVLTSKGQQGSTQVLPNDPDAGDTHRFVVSVDGEHGKVYVSAKGIAVYVPDADFTGGDQFQITVADSQGVTAATWVAAAVRFGPADPTATADIVTYKNTPAAHVVFAPDGVPTGFNITAAPDNGSAEIDATGILSYTPAEGYAGPDSIGVEVSLMAGGTTGVTLTVDVINRVPAPSASGVHTATGVAGTTRIQSGDPDLRDSAVFSITVPPAKGTATIDAEGLLTYTPSIVAGADLLYVRVMDGSGAATTAPVNVTVHLPYEQAVFPAEICNDGRDRVLIAAIEPGHGEVVIEPVQVTATLLYSLAATTEIGIEDPNSSVTVTSVTVAPGCGSVTVSGLLTPAFGGTELAPFPGGNQRVKYPIFLMAGMENSGYWTDSLGGPIVDYYVSFDAWHETLFNQIAFDIGMGEANRADFHPKTAPVLHVRHPNACGLKYREFSYSSQSVASGIAGVFEAPNLPPAIEVAAMLTDIPVTPGKAYTLPLTLKTCGAPVAVTLTTSADWFSVSPTTATLSNSSMLVFEIDADQLPAGDTLIEETLLIHPVDGSFPDIEVPVSAIRLDAIDLADYTPLLTGSQVRNSGTELDLPWPFPFDGVTHTTLSFFSSGSVVLVPPGRDAQELGLSAYGGVHTFAPGIIGGPTIVPFWTNLEGVHNTAWENVSGIYWREVTTESAPHLEVLWWDVQSEFVPDATHNVVRMFLYPDGRFVYEYPSIQPVGLEIATWWYLHGNPGFERVGADLKSGDRFEFGPIE
jgi:hypothetical protein